MKVITLDSRKFVKCCEALAGLIKDSAGEPGMIVGIRSGGAAVADAMSRCFPGVPVQYVTSRRPSTKKKGGMMLRRILQVMPMALLDLLRIIEAKLLRTAGSCEREVVFDEGFKMDAGVSWMLLVDDAVDSGNTLASVVKAINGKWPEIRIVTASVVVTVPDPVFRPDFTLYDNNILIRFPWSMDAVR